MKIYLYILYIIYIYISFYIILYYTIYLIIYIYYIFIYFIYLYIYWTYIYIYYIYSIYIKKKWLTLLLHNIFSFTKSSSLTCNLPWWWLRFSKNWEAEASKECSIKNWVLKVISYFHLLWQIHQLFTYIYLLNFRGFLKCFF